VPEGVRVVHLDQERLPVGGDAEVDAVRRRGLGPVGRDRRPHRRRVRVRERVTAVVADADDLVPADEVPPLGHELDGVRHPDGEVVGQVGGRDQVAERGQHRPGERLVDLPRLDEHGRRVVPH